MSKRSSLKSKSKPKSKILKSVLPRHGKKIGVEDKLSNRENRILSHMERKVATYQYSFVINKMLLNIQLSCTKYGGNIQNKYQNQAESMPQRKSLYLTEDDGEKHALAEHLRSIAPFNHRWKVTETINEGTYGVVFAVRDVETGTKGVIKVAKAVGNDAGNQAAEWEGFVLEKIYKNNPNASIVRLLDKGMLVDQNGAGMEFMVLEKAEVGIIEWLSNYSGLKRKLAVTKAMLQMLKGIYDMHREGLLHRDLKPDNMGILSVEQPFVVLFDLGMTKIYTDEEGECRTPRSTCPFRGTPEWASGWASRGREQNRFDDLIAWLYVACELYDSTSQVTQPLPWTYRHGEQIINYLKTVYCPAHILLRRAPRQFYEINAYLMTANRNIAPKYKFLADKVMEAIKELQKLVDEEKAEKNDSKSGKSLMMKDNKTDSTLDETTRNIADVQGKRKTEKRERK
uniref:Protein kinase domain-containing protein n=1 Tax=Elaeophora elaphi TaxID=1147741 RepID=A0A0R3RRR9_9BILA